MAVLRAIGWTLGGLVALCAGAIALIIGVAWASTGIATERKIQAALEGHYPGKRLLVQHRADWSGANEICFDLIAVDPVSAAKFRRIAMVVGDLDGGTWRFGREYASLDACKTDFSRG
ncbi:hypothetical protein FHS95_002229 [Sphingomonas naasensis]|uniref:Uncharacterized protein n=1 Tax=Sphingomonas naasensis TaxID=1344951 RepID=A0A4S1WNZ6_9SPHN|nr:hypothetical protein [Sphingomonas naasensis]NIJ20537.1 hypothetical protein [Sphingomonas naasensis]TGX44623.1 hypothetical protein E5A74_07610 [Sphingomonas naasensis]